MVLQGLTTRRALSTAALMSLNSSSTLSTPRISLNTCSQVYLSVEPWHPPQSFRLYSISACPGKAKWQGGLAAISPWALLFWQPSRCVVDLLYSLQLLTNTF